MLKPLISKYCLTWHRGKSLMMFGNITFVIELDSRREKRLSVTFDNKRKIKSLVL